MKRHSKTYVIVSLTGILLIALITYSVMRSNHQFASLQSPGWQHLLGTDQLGRDFLARLCVGSLVTLSLTTIVIILSVGIGLMLGLIAGIERKWLDQIVMFMADMLLAIPSFIIALVVLSLVSNSMIGMILALTLGWMGRYLRYFRNLTRDIQKQPFIQYAVLSGNSKVKTTVTHVIPHLCSNIFALITADFGKIMLSISGLAFLGLGIKPPTPELGTILFDGKSYFNGAPWLFFFPGLLLGGYALLFQIINKKITR
ncbi:ABC transporter permease [Staphylococcus pragensis]|uniref:ABC transporter permease n=1 Tax=Staphylococcus pragensis TaxID=1611836 RepID=A0A4Z1B164_9STAP|nr:ABC transporter permease [Staphylococcus pragensis]RTX92007.1 ABC transporter permease [Staphylococcus carnosus]TGN26913.1 ABC transporter permease [Staphylococcus pragensis]GGG93830.1 peptide ABC transporter permease [Staphylococcus pragensis]